MLSYQNNNQAEPKAQRWRAMAEIGDGEKALLYLGSSITQIRENYLDAFENVLDDEIKRKVKKIMIERFDGLADYGRWNPQVILPLPIK